MTVTKVKLWEAILTMDQAEQRTSQPDHSDQQTPPGPGRDVPGTRGDVHHGGGQGEHQTWK